MTTLLLSALWLGACALLYLLLVKAVQARRARTTAAPADLPPITGEITDATADPS